MKLAQITLLLVALLFLGFGIALLLFPVQILALAEIHLIHPTAKMEVRSFYGGLEIGLGIFLLICLARKAFAEGLLLSVLLLAGIVLGRITGAAVDGIEGNYIFYAIPIEGGLFILSLLSLRSLNSPSFKLR